MMKKICTTGTTIVSIFFLKLHYKLEKVLHIISWEPGSTLVSGRVLIPANWLSGLTKADS